MQVVHIWWISKDTPLKKCASFAFGT